MANHQHECQNRTNPSPMTQMPSSKWYAHPLPPPILFTEKERSEEKQQQSIPYTPLDFEHNRLLTMRWMTCTARHRLVPPQGHLPRHHPPSPSPNTSTTTPPRTSRTSTSSRPPRAASKAARRSAAWTGPGATTRTASSASCAGRPAGSCWRTCRPATAPSNPTSPS